MKSAAIGPLVVHFPSHAESIEQLRAEQPKWDCDLIYAKTGIRQRYIAAPDELPSDLAVAAAEKLFQQYAVDRKSIDFLLLCTQTPDYPIPTTACLLQDRLQLPTTCGALDFNLGCSGFVYGLGIAHGLIAANSARRILLITAETYSKWIDPSDRSLRTIFGDAAAATLVEAVETPSLSAFSYGTDGSGANMLMLTRSGLRQGPQRLQPTKRHRWASDLYMDGPALIYFTLDRIPELVDDVLRRSGRRKDEIQVFILHQATRLLIDQLRTQLELDAERLPMVLESCGNTVSSTIPLVIHELRRTGRLRPGGLAMLVGFGVGLSWAGCLWRETWDGQRHLGV